MAEKACKMCKMIFEGQKCPNCGSAESTAEFKGRVTIINPEQSEIAGKLLVKKPGSYTLRLG